MKRNLILGVLSALLLIFVYYYQEERTQKHLEKKEYNERLFKLDQMGELKGFTNSHLAINHYNNRYYIGDIKKNRYASSKNVELFYSSIYDIKIKKVISLNNENYDEYIPKDAPWITFRFEQGHIKFRLGHKINFSSDFYIEVTRDQKRTIVLAQDLSASSDLYNKAQSHRHDRKYKRFASLLNLDEKFFTDRRILQKYTPDDSNWDQLRITNFKGSSFDIFFNDKKTIPLPITPIKLNHLKTDELYQHVKSLEAKSVFYNIEKKRLDQQLATLIVKREKDESSFSLFNRFDKKAGYYLWDKDLKQLYTLERTDCEFLFTNVDYYWDLSLIDRKAKTLELIFDNKTLTIPNIQGPLDSVVINDLEIKSEALKQVKNIITNEALRSWQGQPKLDHYKKLYKIRHLKETFHLYQRAEEILITTDNHKIGVLYYIGTKGIFPLTYRDFFYE